MRISFLYIIFFISGDFFAQNRFAEQKLSSPLTTFTTACPSPISVTATDSASGITLTTNTISCMGKTFFVNANMSNTISDTMNNFYFPVLEIRLIYQTNINLYGKIEEYEGGAYVGCYVGNGGLYPIGTASGGGTTSTSIPGQWWWTWNSCLSGGLDRTKQHTFVFTNTNTTPIPNTTVVVKYPRTNQVLSTTTWSLTSPGSYTVNIPANTNIGKSTYSINPVPSNTLALQDLRDGRCKINPKLLAMGTYTVTYTFSDTLCSGASTNYVFTIGPPNVNWTTPKPCFPGSNINLNTTLSALAQTGGTWTGTGGVSGGFFSPSVGLGTYTVTYTVGSSTCTNTQSHSVTVNATPTVSVASSSVCPGFSTPLSASGATTYSWSPPAGLSSTTGAIVIASPTATTNYTVVGTSNFCSSSAFPGVTVSPKPVANYSVSPQPVLINNPASFTDQSSGATVSNWKWTFGDGTTSTQQSPNHTYSSAGNFGVQLVIISVSGCRDSTTGRVDVIADDIKVYNSFSPNGDGLNDLFEIDNIDQFGTNHVYIYNRWGQLLWDKADYNNKTVVWDGKDSKGTALSPGTYFYIVEVNNKKAQKNWLELTR